MSLFAIKDRIDALVAELNEHNYRYYVLAQPSISDYEFDKKLEELTEKVESSNILKALEDLQEKVKKLTTTE
jgi:NAD-dependent DNA ligase